MLKCILTKIIRLLKRKNKEKAHKNNDLFHKEEIIEYLRKEIVILELYQLAESVIGIVEQGSRSLKKLKPNRLQYKIEFDKTTELDPMLLDCESLERLSKMREKLLVQFSPLWEASDIPRSSPSRVLSPTKRSTKSPIRVQSITKLRSQSIDCQKQELRSRPSIDETPSKPFKQLWSLTDKEIMGRKIELSRYNLCHHCKSIKLIYQDLVECKYSSHRCGVIVPNVTTVNNCTLYNSNLYI